MPRRRVNMDCDCVFVDNNVPASVFIVQCYLVHIFWKFLERQSPFLKAYFALVVSVQGSANRSERRGGLAVREIVLH
jgi:hypothetical protein